MTTEEFREFMARCKSRGLRIDTVAARIGVHKSTVSRWLAGGAIPQLARAACDALDRELIDESAAAKRTILAKVAAAYQAMPMPIVRSLARKAERETGAKILD